MQAVVAYAVYAGVDYGLSRSIRADWIPEVAAAAAEITRTAAPPQPAFPDFADTRTWMWMERVRAFVLEVGTMVLALAALASPRSKAFFAVAAVAAEAAARRQGDEDDDP